MKKEDVGGQAVIEGVMMRGTKGTATAVRTPSGKIEVEFSKEVPITKKYSILNIPFIRGFFVFIDSLLLGVKSLNYSASFFDEDDEPSKFDEWFNKRFGEKSNDILIYISLAISFAMAMGLFVLIPTFIASLFRGITTSSIILNIIEAVIRIVILISYMVGVGRLEDIKRLYQYHGAEHKTISCYASNDELTVENVKKHTRLHPRCGTNFIFLIMFISIIVFSFTSFSSVGERLILRIVLLPLITGITYELIKWLGRNEGVISRIVATPGLKLQLLTTKEPDDDQIEVAIRALKEAEGIKPKEISVGELLSKSTEILKTAEIDSYIIDAQLLLAKVIGKDRLYIITHKEELVPKEQENLMNTYIEERRKKKPLKYITNSAEFMGMEFYIKEGVLIPRGDTEILVHELLDIIKEDKEYKICDLCTGSGAIGISIANLRNNVSVDCIDIEKAPEEVTNINIEKFSLESRARFVHSDLLEQAINNNEEYDIIVSNPPYIKKEVIDTLMEDVKNYEPMVALDGGDDGLDFYRKISEDSRKVLKKDGILAFEIGHDQGEEVKKIMESLGYTDIYVKKDMANLDRIVIGIRKVD